MRITFDTIETDVLNGPQSKIQTNLQFLKFPFHKALLQGLELSTSNPVNPFFRNPQLRIPVTVSKDSKPQTDLYSCEAKNTLKKQKQNIHILICFSALPTILKTKTLNG